MPDRPTIRVTDLETLRALAHPLRVALLGSLRAHGPATASELARRHGETSGATSYHLRQLARFGFVAEAPDQPSRRERRWQATAALTSWRAGDFVDDPAGEEALRELGRRQLEHLNRSLSRWLEERRGRPRAWVEAAESSDLALRLRAEDLAELNRRLWEVIDSVAERPAKDPAAERVQVYLFNFPTGKANP